MKYLSFNYKNGRPFPRFRHTPYPEKYLSSDLDTAIRMLHGVFKDRQYIESGTFTEYDLAAYERELEEELGRGK